jgi:hypothetical protein
MASVFNTRNLIIKNFIFSSGKLEMILKAKKGFFLLHPSNFFNALPYCVRERTRQQQDIYIATGDIHTGDIYSIKWQAN